MSIEVEALTKKLADAYAHKFESDPVITKAIAQLDNCDGGEYRYDKYGDISYCVDLRDRFEDVERIFFCEWVRDNHGYHYETDSQELCSNTGGCIVINMDGSVFDQESHKTITTKSEYTDDDERNALIEAYMEKRGCYSTVLRDSHGSLWVESTVKKEVAK